MARRKDVYRVYSKSGVHNFLSTSISGAKKQFKRKYPNRVISDVSRVRKTR